MLNIKNCILYLENNFFENIVFIKEENGKLFFNATDEDETIKEVSFEQPKESVLFVYIKDGDEWYVLDKVQDDTTL
jgi:hypothetical protein